MLDRLNERYSLISDPGLSFNVIGHVVFGLVWGVIVSLMLEKPLTHWLTKLWKTRKH